MAAFGQTPQDLLERPLEWRVVDDGVMGGVSQGQVKVRNGRLRFEGTVSLDNNGGFSSIRTVPADLDLEGLTGFRITVRGDGQRYAFTVRRSDVRVRAGGYRTKFEATDQPTTIEMPLEAFYVSSYGRRIPDAPSLLGAADKIEGVGFLIADKQAGPFQLDVLAIEPMFATDSES